MRTRTMGEIDEKEKDEEMMRVTYGDGDGHIIFEIRGFTRSDDPRDKFHVRETPDDPEQGPPGNA